MNWSPAIVVAVSNNWKKKSGGYACMFQAVSVKLFSSGKTEIVLINGRSLVNILMIGDHMFHRSVFLYI